MKKAAGRILLEHSAEPFGKREVGGFFKIRNFPITDFFEAIVMCMFHGVNAPSFPLL